MRIAPSLLSTAIMAALLSAPVVADELTGTLKKIKDTGTITLGHRDASIPFSRSTASFQGILRKSKRHRKSLILVEFSTPRCSSGLHGNPPEATTFMSIFVSIFAGTTASGLLLGR